MTRFHQSSARAPPPTNIPRLAALLGMLALVTAAWIYDYAWARPGVEAADKKVTELVAARTRLGAHLAAPVTPAEIHQVLGREPTWVDRHAADHYEVEYYCWWGPVPLLNLRRHYLAIVYLGEHPPRHFSSHHKNEAPPRTALPMPFVEQQPEAVATDDANLPLQARRHRRHPVAAAWIEPDKLLAVANQRSGSISIVDFPKGKVLHEIAVGNRLADIAAGPHGRWLITIDERQHELVVLQREGDLLSVATRLPVSPYPISIAVSKNGNQVSVASSWSRKLTLFESPSESSALDQFKPQAEISLPFNPRDHTFLTDDTLLVSDAFANRSYEVNLKSGTSTSRGQQTPGTSGPYRRLVKGVNLWVEIQGGQERLVSPTKAITLGPAPPPTPEERGEELFYSRTLSAGKNCHDCHAHGHTSYELADTLGDGTTGTPKRVPTLLGTSVTYPWAWNGTISELDEQVKQSLETTMHVKNVTERQVIDITAFLHSLDPPPPLQPATADPTDQAQLARGQSLFQDLGCVKCHVPQLTYSSPDVYDVGLSDERGLSNFNPPSLRGVSQGYSYFHDGRAKSLEEIFTLHGHQLHQPLTPDELSDLLRFLRSL